MTSSMHIAPAKVRVLHSLRLFNKPLQHAEVTMISTLSSGWASFASPQARAKFGAREAVGDLVIDIIRRIGREHLVNTEQILQ